MADAVVAPTGKDRREEREIEEKSIWRKQTGDGGRGVAPNERSHYVLVFVFIYREQN